MKYSLNRRRFLKLGAAAGLSSAFLPTDLFARTFAADRYIDDMGMQLYTVRSVLDDAPAATIEAIAEIGFKQMELHDYRLAATLGDILKANGLRVTSSHFLTALITGRWDILKAFGRDIPEGLRFEDMVEEAVKQEIPNLVMPMLFPQERGDLDHYKSLAESFNRHGEICRDAGIGFAYHNHSFEFEPMGDSYPMEVLITETDPELVSFELDVFWTAVGGHDPAAFIKQHAGRIKMLHLKDVSNTVETNYQTIPLAQQHPEVFREVGNGDLDFGKILKAARKAGVAYCYVEQDQTPGDPLESLRSSYAHLRKVGK
jgi:sugar phosphate isomerase/epimerase